MLLLTPEIRKRLDKVIADGYMVRHGPDYSNCALTDRGMRALLACADSPVHASTLVKPSITCERLWAEADRVRQQLK